MKYKVGDMVRIRKDARLGIYAMAKYKGLKARIESVDEDDECYFIDIDDDKWFWTDEMFEDVDTEV